MINVAIAIINIDNYFLIGKKQVDPNNLISGEWCWPGGKIEEGETIEDALYREVKEETGLLISINKKICTVDNTDWINHFYGCRVHIDSMPSVAGGDLEKITWTGVPKLWFGPNVINYGNLAPEIKAYIDEVRFIKNV